jgi:hypothetical protein
MNTYWKKAAGLLAVAVAAIALAACGGKTGSGVPAVPTTFGPSVSAAASAAKADLGVISKNCGTATAAGQVAAAKDVLTSDGRAKLMAKCGIPEDQRKALGTQLLAAAEKAHLTTHAGRVTYFEVTMPGMILAAQTAASLHGSTPAPSASAT